MWRKDLNFEQQSRLTIELPIFAFDSKTSCSLDKWIWNPFITFDNWDNVSCYVLEEDRRVF